MSDLKVLDHTISNEGKTINIELEQPNGELLEITRIEQSHNKYAYIVEDYCDNEIDITYLVGEKVRSLFSTIYHEQYQLKNL